MEFSISKTALDEALKTVQFALLTRPSKPVLNNVHICVEGNTATFTLSDMEIDICCSAEVEVTHPGTTTLPARRLISIVRKLPDQPVYMSLVDEEFTRINCASVYYKLQGINAAEFPQPFEGLPQVSLQVNKAIIQRMMICTSFACGQDKSRPGTLGPLLDINNSTLTCVATDGRRLATSSQEIDSREIAQSIIPPKTVAALMKLMAGEGDTEIHLDDRKIHFKFVNEYKQQTMISSTLIEAKYPNYKAIIPETNTYTVSLPRQTLYTFLKRAALILSDSNQAVKLTFENNLLYICAETADDRSNEELPVNFEQPAVTIAFNPAFLIEPLNKIDDEFVQLSFSDSQTAAELSGAKGFRYILMPMRM